MIAPERLADTILRRDHDRGTQRQRQQAEHEQQRHAVVDALRAALDPSSDPAPVHAFAAALDVDEPVLRDVLRDAARPGTS